MGKTYNAEEERFDFDFLHDGQNDIISLTGNGYNVEAFGQCFYYGYEFAEQVDGSLRSAFIKYLKFSESIQKDYFTIAKDVKKSRFRPYIQRFLRFASPADEQLYASIHNQNILVVDDVTTSGSTLNEVLRALRTLNDNNHITIFSILGRKDLMAEA